MGPLVWAFLFISSVYGVISLDPKTRRLVDEDGRERYYHGVNVIYKSPPWYPGSLKLLHPHPRQRPKASILICLSAR
jgi:hypothetical protein